MELKNRPTNYSFRFSGVIGIQNGHLVIEGRQLEENKKGVLDFFRTDIKGNEYDADEVDFIKWLSEHVGQEVSANLTCSEGTGNFYDGLTVSYKSPDGKIEVKHFVIKGETI